MRLAGRVAAAIEVLNEVLTRHRPASECLRDWGKAHRFAGSTDRHAIGTLVYDALRTRNSAALQAGGDTPRHIVLGVLLQGWDMPVAEIAAMSLEQHGPGALNDAEAGALSREMSGMPVHVGGNFPEWLAPAFTGLFGENAAAEGAALARRAPIDLRVNTLKADVATVQKALAAFGPVPGPHIATSWAGLKCRTRPRRLRQRFLAQDQARL
jgi:16S rRNA (cytosine967-C5)-methyltransferase